jgi:hypothetical protein
VLWRPHISPDDLAGRVIRDIPIRDIPIHDIPIRDID